MDLYKATSKTDRVSQGNYIQEGRKKVKPGTDLVIIGSIIEKEPEMLREFSHAVHTRH